MVVEPLVGMPSPHPSPSFSLSQLLKGNLQGQSRSKEAKNKACIMLEVESEDPQEKERRWEDFWELCQVAAGGPTADELRSGV